jgi:hypothetical protein
LSTALQNSARAKKDKRDLAAIALGFAKELESTKDAVRKTSGASVDALFEAAKAEGLTAGASDIFAPPTPAKVRTLASLADFPRVSKAPFSSKAVQLEEHPGAALRFVVDDKTLRGGPWACAFDGTPLEGTCTKAPESAVAVNATLRLSAPHLGKATPLWVAGEAGSSGIFRGDTGARVGAPMRFAWATIDASSMVSVLGWDESAKKLRLDRQSSDGTLVSTNVTPPFEVAVENLYYASTTIGDVVLWRGAKEKGGNGHAFAQSILPATSATALGAPIDLGEIGPWYDEGTPHIRACVTGESDLIVVIDGLPENHVVMRIGGAWSAPVVMHGSGAMTCQGKSMQLTRASTYQHRISVAQTRCGNGECVQSSADIKLPDTLTPRSVSAVELGDKIAVVYADSEGGGVRARIGAMKELEHAKEILLFDDHLDAAADGSGAAVVDQSNLYDVVAYATGGSALVLFSTKTGVVPIALDPSGAMSKVAIRGSF